MTLPSGTRGDAARQPPHCYVPATFDPDRHQALEVVAMLVDGHLRHCVTQAIERRQPPDEIARMLAPIQSILFTSHH